MNEKEIVVAGFGTLLLQESFWDTVVDEKHKKFTPIIIKNYRRLFNLLPDHYEASYFLRTDGTELGAANIEPALDAQFNGVSFRVNPNELESLDRRERYYKRSIVPYHNFETGEELGMCHVYESPLNARWLVRNTNDLLPLWRDIVYARVGAYRISKAFGEMYDATTFLADGKTLMIDYYKAYINELEDLEPVRLRYSNK